MDFYDALDQVLELLRQRRRVTHHALKRQFGLDDDCLQDLKDEIIAAQRLAVDEDGRVLVWTGDAAAPLVLPGSSCGFSNEPEEKFCEQVGTVIRIP